MGGLEVDVSKFEHFTGHWAARGTLQSGTLRLSVNGVLQLARMGHFLPIERSKINDKSKADTLQKVLVMTQVLWMATQCIFRLGISLLEIHTMKQKDLLDPDCADTTEFEDIIALMVQEQFHWNESEEFILYAKPSADEHDDVQKQDLQDDQGLAQQINWVEDDGDRVILKTGEVLPSGLGVAAGSSSWETETIQRKVLPPWYDEHAYDDPWDIPDSIWVTEWVEAEPVPPTVARNIGPNSYVITLTKVFVFGRWNYVIRAIENLDGQIREPQAFRDSHQRARNQDRNFHNVFLRSAGNFQYSEESRVDLDQILSFIVDKPILLVLLLVLPGLYGGIHLATAQIQFPTDIEKLL
ncbi:hypothetical protein FDENT_3789 [Fusarium denticulatum]|uniref:Uncharacterized protein n=1 Tax=Fusarium denticulatum TaxID=48507 RepID=A0A8H5UHK9_9HYPO|nr:hypothetical protein FDENT_3789 [Fusarium denticulatum]